MNFYEVKREKIRKKCPVHIHVRKEPMEMTEEANNRVQEGKIKPYNIRPTISYFENPTTDFFISFLFPWNLERLNALSRFLTTKVTN